MIIFYFKIFPMSKTYKHTPFPIEHYLQANSSQCITWSAQFLLVLPGGFSPTIFFYLWHVRFTFGYIA